jgi:RNA polymerase sigma-70 factor (ECF subfamily)
MMPGDSTTNAAASFDPLRPRLIRIAYRMLGSVADAEDIVQEAFIRWMEADRDAVRQPEVFLRRVVARLCLDWLKSARHRRETCVGPWLPEPVVEPTPDDLDDITLPLMMTLERLSPLERAAFLLHDVFDVSFEEVAETIGREPAACRQLAARARAHLKTERPRFPLPKERGLEVAAAFFAATRTGDMERLRSLLATDVIAYADGGGKKPASTEPIAGIDEVMRVLASLARSFRREHVANGALWLYQRLTGIRDDGAGRHAPDDRAGSRPGRQDCRHLHYAQPGQAAASRSGSRSVMGMEPIEGFILSAFTSGYGHTCGQAEAALIRCFDRLHAPARVDLTPCASHFRSMPLWCCRCVGPRLGNPRKRSVTPNG